MSFAFPDDPFTQPFEKQAAEALQLWPLARRAQFLLQGGVTTAELRYAVRAEFFLQASSTFLNLPRPSNQTLHLTFSSNEPI